MRGALVHARIRIGAALVTSAFMLAPASVAFAHPLHTTITEIAYRREGRMVRATIRVFADDFGRVLLHLPATAAAPAASAVTDSAASAYVRAHFSLVGPDGRALPLRWCGVRISGDLVWVCMEAAWDAPLAGVRVLNGMLFDLYHDQINIVQASYDGERSSLLFTKGDAAKAIR